MSLEIKQIKNIVEGALLVADRTLSIDHILALFDLDQRPERDEIRQVLNELEEDFQGRAAELVTVSSGYRLQVRQDYAPWISRLWEEKPQRYSRALLETLSLIAYKQPIIRGEIESIRGVAVSTHIIKTLIERDWAKVVGHKDVPGRPAMYATTKEFLDYFGLKSLENLPTLADVRDLDKINQELPLEVIEELDLVLNASSNSSPDDNAVEFKAYSFPPVVQRGRCRHCNTPAIEFLKMPLMPQFTIIPSSTIADPTLLPEPSFHSFYHRRIDDAHARRVEDHHILALDTDTF